jgi:hypothetical protein
LKELAEFTEHNKKTEQDKLKLLQYQPQPCQLCSLWD